MNEYLKVFIVLFFLWCLYTYLNPNCSFCGDGFTPYVKWTGRDIPFKSCLNNCVGVRSHEYYNCASKCYAKNQFQKHYYIK